MHYQQLTKDERYQIKACLQIGMKQVNIAKFLKRSAATISREIKRNTGKQANDQATTRRLGAKKYIKLTNELKQDIVKLIKQELRSEQVCDYLATQWMWVYNI